MAKDIKNFEDFRQSQEVMIASDYNDKYGYLIDEVDTYVIDYGGCGYINILNEREFYLVIGNQDWRSGNLRMLEEILWDRHAKYSADLNEDEIVADLHERIREFMDEQGWKPLSLDEQPLVIMSIDQLERRNYYLDLFEVDAFRPNPELFVRGVAFIKEILNDYQFDRGHEEYYGFVNVSVDGMARENVKEWEYLCKNPALLKKITFELGGLIQGGRVDVGETIFERQKHKLHARKVLVHDHVHGTNKTILIEDVYEPQNVLYPEKVRDAKVCPIILVNDEEFEKFMTTGFGWIHPDEVSVTLISR